MATLKSIKNKYLSASDGGVLGVTANTENIAALSFKIATADSLSKFNLVDGMSDDYNDTSGVDAAASTDDTRDPSGFYSGKSGNDDITVFNANGSFSVPAVVSAINVLVVAGGGGGGKYAGSGGGGGGAGGVVYQENRTVTPSASLSITIGAGGGGGNQGNGAVGQDSTFDTLTAKGGGGGGVHNGSNGNTGGTGGSGGGGGWQNGGGGATNQASQPGDSGTYGFGNNGAPTSSPSGLGGGAGGGAGAVGSTWTGGVGKLISWATAYGQGGYFAGGGGGAATGAGGPGGTGGGGAGASGSGTAGTANTGGGGGGGSNGSGGAGGSGVVLVQNVLAIEDMTLQSAGFTAQTEPTTARIIIDEESYTGATTLNTDLKAYASRDGTNFTQVILADQGQLNFLAGIDTYTKLMLHCDGSNGGTTFTDSSATAHSMTASGNTHTDTAIKKFGTASAQFDGTGDYITSAASTEFSFTGDFTIDCWCYFSAINTTIAYSQANADWNSATTNDWILLVDGGGNVTFNVKNVGGISSAGHGALNVWKHIAVERASATSKLYVDGALTATSTGPGSGTVSTNNIVALGRASTNLTGGYNGYIDEFRISKGIARYGAAFTPPATPYEHSRRLLSGSVDISGQPSGTNMKYKLTTHNQATAKQTRVYGTSMAWA